MDLMYISRSPITAWSLYGALAVLLGMLAAFAGLGWDPLVSYLCSINLVTLAFFGIDKWRAGRKGFRIPEVVLLGLIGLGGSPLGFVARHLFRHKTRKTSFRLKFWLITILQIILVGVNLVRVP